jgi:hypothetical protein
MVKFKVEVTAQEKGCNSMVTMIMKNVGSQLLQSLLITTRDPTVILPTDISKVSCANIGYKETCFPFVPPSTLSENLVRQNATVNVKNLSNGNWKRKNVNKKVEVVKEEAVDEILEVNEAKTVETLMPIPSNTLSINNHSVQTSNSVPSKFAPLKKRKFTHLSNPAINNTFT